MTFIPNSICPRALEHQTGWSRGSDVDLCLGGAQILSGTSAVLSKVLCGFLEPLQAYAGIVPLLCYDQFLSKLFSIYHSYIIVTSDAIYPGY